MSAFYSSIEVLDNGEVATKIKTRDTAIGDFYSPTLRDNAVLFAIGYQVTHNGGLREEIRRPRKKSQMNEMLILPVHPVWIYVRVARGISNPARSSLAEEALRYPADVGRASGSVNFSTAPRRT